MSEIDQQIDNLRTLQESYNSLIESSVALSPDVAQGKAALATAITSKGVEAASTDSLATMAEKVQEISQDTIEIDGGEMYAKQLYGSLTTPNYWNLYEVLASLLSDGRLVSYGGILLAEYYKGYDSIALSGAGASGAYVVSDMENGVFKMYTEDTTHYWATEDDGKGNRFVAYCFAYEYHDFQITDTNTCPRSIFIGRKVGVISALVAGRISQIVVPDGNKLNSIHMPYVMPFDKKVVFRNLQDIKNTVMCYLPLNTESVYIDIADVSVEVNDGSLISPADYNFNASFIITSPNDGWESIKVGRQFAIIGDEGYNRSTANYIFCGLKDLKTNIIKRYKEVKECIICAENIFYPGSVVTGESALVSAVSSIGKVILPNIEYNEIPTWMNLCSGASPSYIFIGYKENDRTKNLTLRNYTGAQSCPDIELKNGYKKNLDISELSTEITAENIALHMLDKLADNTGEETLTLTIGSTNLNRILADETYASYVTAAQAKNWTIA